MLVHSISVKKSSKMIKNDTQDEKNNCFDHNLLIFWLFWEFLSLLSSENRPRCVAVQQLVMTGHNQSGCLIWRLATAVNRYILSHSNCCKEIYCDRQQLLWTDVSYATATAGNGCILSHSNYCKQMYPTLQQLLWMDVSYPIATAVNRYNLSNSKYCDQI
jgi:hypothetical protein